MKIIAQSREFSSLDIYHMTNSEATVSIKKLWDSDEIRVCDYLIYETEKKGKTVTLLFILGDDGKMYKTKSKHFISSFKICAMAVSGVGFSIRKVTRTLKSGKRVIKCRLV